MHSICMLDLKNAFKHLHSVIYLFNLVTHKIIFLFFLLLLFDMIIIALTSTFYYKIEKYLSISSS